MTEQSDTTGYTFSVTENMKADMRTLASILEKRSYNAIFDKAMEHVREKGPDKITNLFPKRSEYVRVYLEDEDYSLLQQMHEESGIPKTKIARAIMQNLIDKYREEIDKYVPPKMVRIVPLTDPEKRVLKIAKDLRAGKRGQIYAKTMEPRGKTCLL